MQTNLIHRIKILILTGTILMIVSCGNGSKSTDTDKKEQNIMVFAAASLTDVLSEIIDSFEVKYQVKIQTNMASSGTLARQIEQGGTPDVYISASKKWADYVDSIGGLLPGTKMQIVKNELALIAPQNSPVKVAEIDGSLDIISMLGNNRLSMGDPAHVPAGRYAKQALEYFGWWSQLENRILPGKDVRSALMVVEMGESPLGIVYRTDALKSKKVTILSTFPEQSHKPVVYVGGICKDNDAAKQFFAFLTGEETRGIWEKYGFKK